MHCFVFVAPTNWKCANHTPLSLARVVTVCVCVCVCACVSVPPSPIHGQVLSPKVTSRLCSGAWNCSSFERHSVPLQRKCTHVLMEKQRQVHSQLPSSIGLLAMHLLKVGCAWHVVVDCIGLVEKKKKRRASWIYNQVIIVVQTICTHLPGLELHFCHPIPRPFGFSRMQAIQAG